MRVAIKGEGARGRRGTAPVSADAIAVCTPSEERGSINRPASPRSRKRSPANWRAVFRVASETRGATGSDAAPRNFETYESLAISDK